MSDVLVSLAGTSTSGLGTATTGQPEIKYTGAWQKSGGVGYVTAVASCGYDCGSTEYTVSATISVLPASGQRMSLMAIQGAGQYYAVELSDYGNVLIYKRDSGQYPWSANPSVAASASFQAGDTLGLRISTSGGKRKVEALRNGAAIPAAANSGLGYASVSYDETGGWATKVGGIVASDSTARITAMSIKDDAVQTVTAPTAPTGVAATAITDKTATVTWNQVAGATSYQVTVNGVAYAATTALTQPVSGLTADTTYTVSVKASNSAGNATGTGSFKTALAPVVANPNAWTAASPGPAGVRNTGTGRVTYSNKARR